MEITQEYKLSLKVNLRTLKCKWISMTTHPKFALIMKHDTKQE